MLFFITAIGGWYVLIAQTLASLGFSIQFPLGNRFARKALDEDKGSTAV